MKLQVLCVINQCAWTLILTEKKAELLHPTICPLPVPQTSSPFFSLATHTAVKESKPRNRCLGKVRRVLLAKLLYERRGEGKRLRREARYTPIKVSGRKVTMGVSPRRPFASVSSVDPVSLGSCLLARVFPVKDAPGTFLVSPSLDQARKTFFPSIYYQKVGMLQTSAAPKMLLETAMTGNLRPKENHSCSSS